jgi:hypothetical protein
MLEEKARERERKEANRAHALRKKQEEGNEKRLIVPLLEEKARAWKRLKVKRPCSMEKQ